ncbi:DUF4442 domain-containing protein [Phaeodactylibacter sp.]|uniref:DUF4442 domain-containing protein n=1 Tax=Phaeodactylibacter sp. TaxID=1940289 RepID=UPI0025EE85C8|nr:DUF4442 domain-containing protein [Phaeodactylibacter sp.]MCI4648812.1 DUF4442 domain-containing protein [Phaeodactylibacter sp.]MCI5092333.1 DUF4442 domain-containing protein [Phaeodactylibacter sp.]
MATNASPKPASNTTLPVQKRLRDFNTSWKMRLFFLKQLPSCWFWDIRVDRCDTDSCVVSIPYRWTTQNPFRSTYFAALSGAAELSTGTLALLALTGKGRVSMLITGFEATFIKKADTRTTFTCNAGAEINAAVDRAIATGTGQDVTVLTTGRNTHGDVVCKMHLTWSFKKKA